MPIFKFIAVTATVLLGLLFLADKMLTPSPSGPRFANDSEGLTRAEPKQKQAKRPEPVEAREAPRPRAVSVAGRRREGRAGARRDRALRVAAARHCGACASAGSSRCSGGHRGPGSGRRPGACSGPRACAALPAIETPTLPPVTPVDPRRRPQWPRLKLRRSRLRKPSLRRSRLRRPKLSGSRPPRSKRPRLNRSRLNRPRPNRSRRKLPSLKRSSLQRPKPKASRPKASPLKRPSTR